MTKTLETLTVDQLREEIERRRQVDELRKNIPAQLGNPDWTIVRKLCDDHMLATARKNADEDTPYYIYEAVMEAIYGANIFEWINAVSR